MAAEQNGGSPRPDLNGKKNGEAADHEAAAATFRLRATAYGSVLTTLINEGRIIGGSGLVLERVTGMHNHMQTEVSEEIVESLTRAGISDNVGTSALKNFADGDPLIERLSK